MSRDHSWSSKLVHKEDKNFFIRTIKLNPFPTYLNVIVVKSTMKRWYDYLVNEKYIDIWQKIAEMHPNNDDVFDKRDQELVKDFLNNGTSDDRPSPGGAITKDGGMCVFTPDSNQWFLLVKEHDTVKRCLTTLVHEIQHVTQRLGIEYAMDASIWATTEMFSYMADMIFNELFDDIAKQYSLF